MPNAKLMGVCGHQSHKKTSTRKPDSEHEVDYKIGACILQERKYVYLASEVAEYRTEHERTQTCILVVKL